MAHRFSRTTYRLGHLEGLYTRNRRISPWTRQVPRSADFTSYPLESKTPPPRNVDVPDTSITDPPIRTSNRIPQNAEKTEIGVSEGEAQISKPVTPRKRTLRPRKAVMILTPPAVDQLRVLLSAPDPKLIRVGVKNRGCSGLAYHLEYVEKAAAFDETVEQDGVKVLVDSKALFSIIGSEMDWVSEKLGERFVFRNPNISEYICHYYAH